MVDPLPIPYKDRYHLVEFWTELKRSPQWATYRRQNPKEAAALDLHAQRRIDELGDQTPANLTHTFTGNALLMAILSLPGGHPDV